MTEPSTAPTTSFLPLERSLVTLASAAAGCRGCPLYAHDVQTVFGKGTEQARLVLVGEQPGDREDRAGEPFVGPAGRILDDALEAAGILRKDVYVTNAVKHFKHEVRGKRRIHQRPNASEVRACRPWLDAELELLRPRVVVMLGATPSKALLGSQFRVTRDRGKVVEVPFAQAALATWHPAAIVRERDSSTRERLTDELVVDLGKAREILSAAPV